MRHARFVGSCLFSIVSIVAVATVATTGCRASDDGETTSTSATEPDASRRLSQKGELCQVTNDCVDGLACIPISGSFGGICSVTKFEVAPTAKECALVECREPVDCCPLPPTSCSTWQAGCADAGAGSLVCQQYEAYCKCDATKRDCVADKCVTKCTADAECGMFGPGVKCTGGRCGAGTCAADADCGTGAICVAGMCQAPCRSDGDCAGFARCIAGKCEESGCKTDRECVAATKNVEAKCGSDGECIVPCENDIECGNPKGYAFVSCIDKRCTYTGCESDKDCRLFTMGPQENAGPQPLNRQFVCRAKK